MTEAEDADADDDVVILDAPPPPTTSTPGAGTDSAPTMDAEEESRPEVGGGRASGEAEEESDLRVRLASLMVGGEAEAGRPEGEEEARDGRPEAEAGRTEGEEEAGGERSEGGDAGRAGDE